MGVDVGKGLEDVGEGLEDIVLNLQVSHRSSPSSSIAI